MHFGIKSLKTCKARQLSSNLYEMKAEAQLQHHDNHKSYIYFYLVAEEIIQQQ